MGYKKNILFVIVFLVSNTLAFSHPFTDTCYKSFLKKYGATGTWLEVKDVCRTSDGGYILSGFKGPQYYPIVIKLNSSGTVEWNKYFADPIWARKVLQTNDGNFIVATFSDKTQLTKFDNSGNILWSKQFSIQGTSELVFTDIQKVTDGGFVIIFNTSIGSGYTFNYIVRTDADGNMLWKKEILHSVSQPILKSVLVDGNQIYIASDSYTFGLRNLLDIARLDLGTGDFIWAKTYESTEGTLFDPHLALLHDSVIVSPTRKWTVNFRDTSTVAVITLNANSGNKLSSYEFISPTISFNTFYYAIYMIGPFQFNKTNDGNLFFAQLVYYNNDTLLNVTKFTPAGNTIWSKNYKNFSKNDVWAVKADGDEMLIAGRHYTGYPNTTDIAFIIRINRNGNVTDQPVAPSEDCYNESIVPTIQPLSLNAAPANLFSTTDAQIVATNFVPVFNSANVFTTESCFVIDSTCTTLSLTGPDSVCQSAALYTYVAHRGSGCNNSITWTYDTSIIHLINVTDSSITVQFLKTDSAIIQAKLIGSCSNISINKTVHNNPNADSLNLGADQSFCFPGNVLINAGKGFKNYLWNNGSSDSAIIVSIPGTYYVNVIDYCGNHSSDTMTITNAPVVPVDIGIDRNKCNNDTVRLAATAGFMNYIWGPNYNISSLVTQQVVVNPSVDTIYFVKAEKTPGCFGYDTVRINVHTSLLINLGPDKSICKGDSVLLNAGAGFSQYLWSTGSVLQQLTVYNTGDYNIKATSPEGCNSYDTIHVNAWPLPAVHLDKDSTLCKGSSRVLQAGSFISYRWQDGSILPSLTVSNTGKYFVTVTDLNACKGSDSVNITTLLSLPRAFLPNDTAICSYASIVLQPLSNFTDYLWNTGVISPSITISQQGVYWLQVKDNHQCVGTDSIVVKPKDCLKGLFVPNAFTPDNNGRNDNFKPFVGGVVKQYQFIIYNRYGQVVFRTQAINNGWDGIFGGKPQNAATFVWVCNYQLEGESLKTEKGTFLLLR